MIRYTSDCFGRHHKITSRPDHQRSPGSPDRSPDHHRSPDHRSPDAPAATSFPLPLARRTWTRPAPPSWRCCGRGSQQQPMNAVATAIFLLAVLHTFVANRFRRAAHHAQHALRRRAARPRPAPPQPSFKAEMLHFLGEVEVVFGLWVLVLLAAVSMTLDWDTARPTSPRRVHYVEPMFVVVIMAIAATRPVVELRAGHAAARGGARRAHAGGVVVHHPHARPGARLVHHRAGGHDHLRAAARPPVLRAAAEPAPALRHAGPAVRQRLDRRHAHALRGAAGADGGAPPGAGRSPSWPRTSAGRPASAIVISNARLLRAVPARVPALDDDRRRHHRGRWRPAAGRLRGGLPPCTWRSWRSS